MERNYEDIKKILHQNQGDFKVTEHRDSTGHFKSFIVET